MTWVKLKFTLFDMIMNMYLPFDAAVNGELKAQFSLYHVCLTLNFFYY